MSDTDWRAVSDTTFDPTCPACRAKQPKYTPKGTHFFDLASGRMMLLVDDDVPEWGGWLCWKHPDGQWVSERQATGYDRATIAAEVARSDARWRALLALCRQTELTRTEPNQ